MRSLRNPRHLLLLAGAASIGAALSLAIDGLDELVDVLVWFPLAALLYATFIDVDLGALGRALRDEQFLIASLGANFVIVPFVVAVLVSPLSAYPALQLGTAMVLLVPCTDWFSTFTRIGGGDVRRAIAITPLQLVAQLLLLPIYLRLIVGDVVEDRLDAEPFLVAFGAVILLPLVLAALTRRALISTGREGWMDGITGAVPYLLAITLLLVAASQAPAVVDAGVGLFRVAVIVIAYAVLALLIARLVARVVHLDVPGRRTLAYNIGTRNSFVVLPLALALPADLQPAAAAIALQSIIELAAMLAYLYAVPLFVFPGRGFEME